MEPQSPNIIHLADYHPTAFSTQRTELDFDIHEGMTQVHCRQFIKRRSKAPTNAPLELYGVDLELLSVSIDGRELSGNEYQLDDFTLTVHDLPDDCVIDVVTRIHPEKNTALEGLYRSRNMYCTQCEAEGFRKITYYQDRPDVLSRFKTTIRADAEHFPILLSNGNLVDEVSLSDGRHMKCWEDPFPKPSYLFALVAGDLALMTDEFTTCSGRKVELRIYSEPHNISQCDYAMAALKRAMKWDEEAYGREYDLDIFMIVAVEDFNMGAMENKGLNIFNTSCVLASPDTATDQAYLRVEGVVAHEYFHNWSGNRVTCRDWFQLSLKEGFTVLRDSQFSAAMNDQTIKRIEDVNLLRSVQFAEDAGPLAHPIRPSAFIEISNFYTATIYEKGSEVVGMLHTLLGPALFRQGTDLYFSRHDGGAVTTEDFVHAMSEVSGIDLDQFQHWYDQAGTPELTVIQSFDDGMLRLQIDQRTPPTPGQNKKKPLHIPVIIGLLDDQGTELVNSDLAVQSSADYSIRSSSNSLLIELRKPSTEISISGLAKKPLVSFLRSFSAPVRVKFDRSPDQLANLAAKDSDGFSRWDVLQELVIQEIGQIRQGKPIRQLIIDLFAGLIDQAKQSSDSFEHRFVLAKMLTLPAENYLFESAATIDVDGLIQGRDALADGLAAALAKPLSDLFYRCRDNSAYSPTPEAIAGRALKHAAMSLLVRCQSVSELQKLLNEEYHLADNLTDRRAVLHTAVNAVDLPQDYATGLFDDFHHHWQSESLVMDLWFQLQSTSIHCGVNKVTALESHPDYDAKNPNKLRSVLGGFSGQNLRNFHVSDGSGYRFLAQRVTEIDRSNPQIAARLALPLTKWQRIEGQRQKLMCDALRSIAAGPELSTDLFEIVSKSLKDS